MGFWGGVGRGGEVFFFTKKTTELRKRTAGKKRDFADMSLRRVWRPWIHVEGLDLVVDPEKTPLDSREGPESPVGTMARVGEEP